MPGNDDRSLDILEMALKQYSQNFLWRMERQTFKNNPNPRAYPHPISLIRSTFLR